MTAYFNTVTKEYPRHEGDLELLGWVKGTSLPENWVQVTYIEPDIEMYTVAEETLPVLVDGQWVTNWVTKTLSDEEITKLEADRVERETKKFDPPESI